MDSKFILIFLAPMSNTNASFSEWGEKKQEKKKEQRGELVNGDSGDRAAPLLQSTR